MKNIYIPLKETKRWLSELLFGPPRNIILNKMPKNSVCAEIGVWKGEFSEKILKITKPKMLHLIDPWVFQGEYPNRWYGGAVAKNQEDMERIFNSVETWGNKFNNVCIRRGFSEKVLQKFSDGYFDWIYIDGNHSYEAVKKDLEIGYKKVKPNGFIIGDDYYWGERGDLTVRQAVHEFIELRQVSKFEIFSSQFLIGK